MKKTLIILLIAAFTATALPLTSNAASIIDAKINRPILKVKTTAKILPELKTKISEKIAQPTITPVHLLYSGDYQMTYNLESIEITLAGATKNVSLDEIRLGGVTVGSIKLPAEIADQIEETLASQINVKIESKHIGPFYKITLQGNRDGDEPIDGLINGKTKQFTVLRLKADASSNGQCAAIGGVIAQGTFDKQDGAPVIDGASTVGLLFGCHGLLAGAKATINWTATQL